MLTLGIDVGTQGAKALVLDADSGTVLARAARAYGLIEGLAPGAAEQHPDTWIDAVRVVSRELARALGSRWRDVEALGVSGQQHGLVVLDERGQPIRPAKLWCDTETAAEARELSERIGRPIPAGYTASKILWLARREPASWGRTRTVLLPHDYVNLRATGRATMEAGDASGTGFFDPVARNFDEVAMRAVDPRLAERLPPLVAAGEPAGTLSSAGAELLGLAAGTLVAAGGGDNMLSAIGSGATRPGLAVVSLGTSGTVFTYSAEPVVDPTGAIAPFCDSTGGWLPLLCVMNATGVAEEVRTAFGLEHAELTQLAADEPAGAHGLHLLPYMQGERVPDLPLATGSLHGLRPGLLRPGLVYRAALEGVALNLAWGVERMRALGLAVAEVRLVGGGAKNLLWCSILADALDCPLQLLAESESAALGGALQAAWTLARSRGERADLSELAARAVRGDGERVRPDRGRAALYREARGELIDLAQRLHGAR